MEGTHYYFNIYFNINTYDWVLIPDKKLNFCIKNNLKKVGKAVLSLFQVYDMLNYGIFTIENINKIEDLSQNIMFKTYFKYIKYFDILNADGDLTGSSNLLVRSCIEKDFITKYERNFYKTLELLKYRYKVNNYLLPLEIWNIIFKFLDPYQEKITCKLDSNIEHCQGKIYDIYIYEVSRIQERVYYYGIPYPHTRKEARKSICKYNNWKENICGLSLAYKGDMIKEEGPDAYSLYLFNSNREYNTSSYPSKESIKFINKESEEIFKNNVIKIDLKNYNITSIYII